MDFYYTKSNAMQNLGKLFGIYMTLKYSINDEKIRDATEKTILTIFNKYGEKVYNKTENSFYKRIMDESTDYHKAEHSYRYYPNGLVYHINFNLNKNSVEEECPLSSNDNFLNSMMMLKEYKIPASFEKKIKLNREKIKEEQLKAIDKQKEKEARRKAAADKKEAIKAANIEQKNPCLSFLDGMGYSSRNIRSNFIRYQLSKWYEDIKKPIVPKIFKDNPPLYEIMEKLNKINEDINLKTVIKDFHYEYQAEDNDNEYIYEWSWSSAFVDRCSDIANLSIAREAMSKLIEDKVCYNYEILIKKIFSDFFCGVFTSVLNKNKIYGRNKKIKTEFVLIKDKDSFEHMRTKNHVIYGGFVLLDTVKYTNEIDVKLSDECPVKDNWAKKYKRGVYDGKNIIAFPYLSTICEAWPVFIEKVKECEYGEEWLERVGFIPPKKNK